MRAWAVAASPSRVASAACRAAPGLDVGTGEDAHL
jgi:hypothetical protein